MLHLINHNVKKNLPKTSFEPMKVELKCPKPLFNDNNGILPTKIKNILKNKSNKTSKTNCHHTRYNGNLKGICRDFHTPKSNTQKTKNKFKSFFPRLNAENKLVKNTWYSSWGTILWSTLTGFLILVGLFVYFYDTIMPQLESWAWFTSLKLFVGIWPLRLWITSLTGLILLYWVTGHYYNKWLSPWGGWLDFSIRVWLICGDLGINLGIGMYCMEHRDTLLGTFMLQCPIAISPLIFILELMCVYAYQRYLWSSKSKGKPLSTENTVETTKIPVPVIVKKDNVEKDEKLSQNENIEKKLPQTIDDEKALPKKQPETSDELFPKNEIIIPKEQTMIHYLQELEKWKSRWPWARGKPPVRPK